MVHKEKDEDSFGLLEELSNYLLNLEPNQMPNLYKYIEQLYEHLNMDTNYDELSEFIVYLKTLELENF